MSRRAQRSGSHPRLVASVVTGCLAGIVAGWIYLAIGLVLNGGELALAAPSGTFVVWVVARSLGLYGLAFGAAGLVLGAVVHGFGAILRRPGELVFPIVLGLLVAGIAFAYLSVWWQLRVLAGLPFGDAARLAGAVRHGLYGLGMGLCVAALTALGGRLIGGGGRAGTPWRSTVVAVVVCAGAVGASQVALAPGQAAVDGAYRPSQVVVVGMDALTFRILGPMLRSGELPTFRRLIDEGAWGSFLTYGQASSPMVWTSMATGKRVRD
ncbi:MAG: alkaline phosphatase family protein, partial [Candidatus Eiseniibacteriota bacterium]